MREKILLISCTLFITLHHQAFANPGPGFAPGDSAIAFLAAPNPCSDKCLIRVYLPVNDPFASIRLLKADSTLVKEFPLGTETGIGSAPLNVARMDSGNYLYQLFYKGETRSTQSLIIRH